MKLDLENPLYVVGYAAAVSAAFTAAVMCVQVATAARIRRNEAVREKRALVQAFGLGDVAEMSDEAISALVEGRIEGPESVSDPETGRAFRVFRAYGEGRSLRGVAFDVSGRGFWAPITGLMALSPDLARVKGIVFLDHSETPGLGGRITEAWFRKQFEGLDVTPPRAGHRSIYIEREKPTSEADPRHGRTVDAITGATQTSMAVARLLNANIQQFRRAMAAAQGAEG